MSKLSNCLCMIELLHARGKMKISELAEVLEVKEHMIRIYRDDIEMAGIFIYYRTVLASPIISCYVPEFCISYTNIF